MNEIAVRVRVHGRVQGVFYRQSCLDRARAAGVRGWVTNMADGSVEALFAGAPEAVDRMVRWCYEGPPSAYVRSVDEDRSDPAQAPKRFEVR